MRKIRHLLFLPILLCILTMVSCSSGENQPSAETGFPNGQVQREMLYYRGQVWGLDFYGTEKPTSLPDGFTLVGVTCGENPEAVPAKELHTAHIPENVEVYASTDDTACIYLKDYWGEGTFGRFVVIDVSSYTE